MVVLLFEDDKCYLDGKIIEWYYHHINVEGKGITEVKGKVPNCTHSLTLSKNKIRDLSQLDVNNLNFIDLDFNEIERIDNFHAGELLEVDMAHNRITTLDGFNLGNIEYLSLAHNLIEEVSEIDTQKLNDLFLNDNKIRHVDFNTGNLLTLGLHNNELESIDKLTISPILSELYLADNKLTEFKKSVNLIYLTLDNNKITSPFNLECDRSDNLVIDNMKNEKEEMIACSEMLNEYKDYIIRNSKKSARK